MKIIYKRRIIASHLLTPSSRINNPKHNSQLKLVKDRNSNMVNDLLINKTKPVVLYDNLLTIRNTDIKFELKGDLLKMITNKS